MKSLPAIAVCLLALSCRTIKPADEPSITIPIATTKMEIAPKAPVAALDRSPADGWISLFDGQTLGDWKITTQDDFAAHGEVVLVNDGIVVLGEGKPYTGITWTGDFPTENYEVALEAARLSGGELFCGLTVPVGESHVTLVMGGWGDSVVGLSDVDDWNANDNETTENMGFHNNQWYSVQLRVTEESIEAWIDAERVVDLKRKGHTFSIYVELDPQRPLGVFSWNTKTALRKIEMRRLEP